MQVEGWKKISNECKEYLFRKLVDKLTYEVEEPYAVKCIWRSFVKQYSSFRSNAHKYYVEMKKECGVSLARQRVYKKLVTRPDDWLWLCYVEMKKECGVSLARQRVYKKLATRPDDWLWLCNF